MFSSAVKQVVHNTGRRVLVRYTVVTRKLHGSEVCWRTMATQEIDETPHATTEKENERKPLWRSPYLAAAHVKVMEGSTPECARVLHPGPALEMLDRYGHPSLVSLLQLASVSRMLAMHSPVDSSGRTFFDYSKLTESCFTFFNTTCVTMSKSMCDTKVSKWPLEVEVRPGHIGRTSLSTVSTVICPTHRHVGELFRQISQVVLVDKATRKPRPVGDEWKKLYLPHCVRGEQGLIIPRQQPPPEGPDSVYKVTVAWSDTDNYNHVNFTSYPRFALDALHDALDQGHLKGRLTEEDVANGVAELQVSYSREAVQGEELTVKVWSLREEKRTVVCSMEKEGQIINQVMLTFHAADLPGHL